jgi:hypothetical protein
MQATTFPPHSCRYNKLGAAGAKELVKGDWPELRVLHIGWGWAGDAALCSPAQLTNGRILMLSLCHHTLSCRVNDLGDEGAVHLATGRWPKLQELDIL